jgi:hypothetical protein
MWQASALVLLLEEISVATMWQASALVLLLEEVSVATHHVFL